MCVCVQTKTFELNDLWPRHLACWFIWRVSRWSPKDRWKFTVAVAKVVDTISNEGFLVYYDYEADICWNDCTYVLYNGQPYVYSRSRSVYAVARPSVVCLSVRCLSSVTFVRPTQPVEVFDNVSTPFGTFVVVDIHGKFYGDRPRETPPSGGG